MDNLDIKTIHFKLDHIEACAEIWSGSGVSRFKAINRTVAELRLVLNNEIEKEGVDKPKRLG